MLEQSHEISFLERLRNDLGSLRETLDEAHQIYYSKLVDPQEMNEAYQWFDVRDREHFQCRTKINEAIKAQEFVTFSDRVSRKGLLSKSSHSSRNSLSSVRSKIARAAVKAASLQIEMDFIHQEAEYKRQSMLKEIAKAKAEQDVEEIRGSIRAK